MASFVQRDNEPGCQASPPLIDPGSFSAAFLFRYAGVVGPHGDENGTQDPSGHCFLSPQQKHIGTVALRFPKAPTVVGASCMVSFQFSVTGWGAPEMVKVKSSGSLKSQDSCCTTEANHGP